MQLVELAADLEASVCSLKNIGGGLAAILLVMLCFGCAQTRQLPIRPGVAPGTDLAQLSKGITVVGYTTRDGVRHSFQGTARLQARTWSFASRAEWGEKRPLPITLPEDQVEWLEIEEGSYRNPLVVGGVIIVVLAALAGLGLLIGAGSLR